MIVKNGYICRQSPIGKALGHVKIGKYRDWWLVKYNSSGTSGFLSMQNITLPKEYVGKKIRLKIEVIEEKPHARI